MKSILVMLLIFTSLTVSFAQQEMYDICPVKNSEKIPSAIVYDSDGKEINIKDYISNKPAVVVFYRGGWCPYCIRHLSALGEAKEAIDKLGFELIAITPDDFTNLDISKEKSGGIDYKLFSDKDINAINAFGIGWKINEELYLKYKNSYNIDIEWWTGSKHHILPVPSIFVVKDGIIEYQHVNPKYSERLSPEILLSYLKSLKPIEKPVLETSSTQRSFLPTKQKEDTKVKGKPVDVQFPSADGLMISANLYEIDKTSPVIVLCHQARYNKYEYNSIATKLNEKGFNCIAIDQRSGGEMKSTDNTDNSYVNETFLRAKKEGKATEYLDAEQDIIAAVKYAKNIHKSPLILWGSSYSSTLALYIALENDAVNAVISFSPGNYLSKSKGSLIDKLPNLKKSAFITSSKQEIVYIDQLLEKTTLNENQVHFKPKGTGYHGSKALWPKQTGGEEYWVAIDKFLEKTKEMFANKN